MYCRSKSANRELTLIICGQSESAQGTHLESYLVEYKIPAIFASQIHNSLKCLFTWVVKVIDYHNLVPIQQQLQCSMAANVTSSTSHQNTPFQMLLSICHHILWHDLVQLIPPPQLPSVLTLNLFKTVPGGVWFSLTSRDASLLERESFFQYHCKLCGLNMGMLSIFPGNASLFYFAPVHVCIGFMLQALPHNSPKPRPWTSHWSCAPLKQWSIHHQHSLFEIQKKFKKQNSSTVWTQILQHVKIIHNFNCGLPSAKKIFTCQGQCSHTHKLTKKYMFHCQALKWEGWILVFCGHGRRGLSGFIKIRNKYKWNHVAVMVAFVVIARIDTGGYKLHSSNTSSCRNQHWWSSLQLLCWRECHL